MQHLKATLRGKAGEVYDLRELTAIGRSSEAEVTLADPRVSRRHALIRWQEESFWFFDLGSSNGSYVNGRRVTAAQALRDGDTIQIGSSYLEFRGEGRPENGPRMHDTALTLVEVRSREVIILVCDLEGFTALSEKLEPEVLAPMIGTWYREVEKALEKHGATIDKFIGDCVLAYWLGTSEASRRNAMAAAAAMQEACDVVRQTHEDVLEKLNLDFQSGTALHLGSVAHGALGGGEFSLLGDTVNLAFRLEGLTRTLGCPVLLSGDFLEGWDDGRERCQSRGRHKVKGRDEEIEVFSMEGSFEE